MKYLNKSFQVGGYGKVYSSEYEKVFGKKEDKLDDAEAVKELKERGYSSTSIQTILRGLKQAAEGNLIDMGTFEEFLKEEEEE